VGCKEEEEACAVTADTNSEVTDGVIEDALAIATCSELRELLRGGATLITTSGDDVAADDARMLENVPCNDGAQVAVVDEIAVSPPHGDLPAG
jgi:hypothetical protein